MKLIPLTRGMYAKIDDEDFEKVSRFKWHASFHGKAGHEKWYACTHKQVSTKRRAKRSKLRMHRLIMDVTGKEVVHHKDDDGLNNQKSNLEILPNNAHNMYYSSGWRGNK